VAYYQLSDRALHCMPTYIMIGSQRSISTKNIASTSQISFLRDIAFRSLGNMCTPSCFQRLPSTSMLSGLS
jgi:hypothetical protein